MRTHSRIADRLLLLCFAAVAAFAEGAQTPKTNPVLSAATTQNRASAAEVVSVEIFSGWGGLGAGSETHLAITRTPSDSFVMNGYCRESQGMRIYKHIPSAKKEAAEKAKAERNHCPMTSEPVNDALVAALVQALREPVIDKPTLASIGLDEKWLTEVARNDCVGTHSPTYCSHGSPKQRELFARTLTDPAQAQTIFADLFRSIHFDDYPASRVVVKLTNGEKLAGESHSYWPFMLPWKIGERETYNGRISRVLSALMPRNGSNRARLGGDNMADEMAEATHWKIKAAWNEIGAEEEIGGAVARLRTQYKLSNVDVNEYHNFDHGDKWDAKHKTHERNLHAVLKRDGWPENFSLNLTLRRGAKDVDGLDEFLKNAPEYAQRLLSVGWLANFYAENPKLHLTMRYVHDASFGEKALATFELDMHALGRDAMAHEVAVHRNEVIQFEAVNGGSSSTWLLLPNSQLMLWRFAGPLPILRWRPVNFTVRECGDYGFNGGGCSGALISPTGELLDDMQRSPLDVCLSAGSRAALAAAQSARKGKHDPLFPIRAANGKNEYGRTNYLEGYIDASGAVVLPPILESAGEFHEDRARFQCGGRWGFFEKDLNVVAPPTLSWAENFSEGLARVQPEGEALSFGGEWGFMDRSGRIAIASKLKHLVYGEEHFGEFRDGLAMIESDENSEVGYIDKNGKVVIPPSFGLSWGFSEGLAAAQSSKENLFGYIDKQGLWIIKPQFKIAFSFVDGLARTQTGTQCVVIDKYGNTRDTWTLVDENQNCPRGDYHEGLASFRKDGKTGYIDKSGSFVVAPQFTGADDFSEGFATVQLGNLTTYIDKSGHQIFPPRALIRAEAFHEGLAYVVDKDGRAAYVDKSGRIVWQEMK
jgi:hypothetical protein